MKKIIKEEYYYLLLLIFLCIPAVLPFFHKGYFPTHDGEWAVVRLGDMFRSIRDMQFPVRYSGNLNFGYGYPLFNFAYPLPYYLGIFFILIKFGLVNSVKTLFILSVFLSAISMFFASSSFWKNNLSGLISSVLYVYLPYRFVDLYVRGSIGESLSFIAFPLIFYFVNKIGNGKNSATFVILAAFTYSLLIPTHNIMTVLFTPILIIFIFCQYFFAKKNYLPHFLFFFILSYTFTAFFWIPALYEKSNILLSKIPIADRSLYFVTWKQLLIPSWGYGTPTERNAFTYQIGLPQIVSFILLLVFTFFIWIKEKSKKIWENKMVVVFLAYIIFMVFLTFSQSLFFWKSTPLFSEINYPWTLLSQIGFLIAFLSGLLARQKILFYMECIIAVAAIMLFLPYARAKEFVNHGDLYYLTNQATTTSSNELMPIWVKYLPTQTFKNKIEVLQGKITFQSTIFNSRNLTSYVDVQKDSIVRINTIYYPGWHVSIDKKMTDINYKNDKGVIDFNISKGKHIIQATFSETHVRLISDFISALSILIALAALLNIRYKFLKTNT